MLNRICVDTLEIIRYYIIIKKIIKMGEKMKILEELIIQNGKVIDNSILKVDSFLNHQIDANLMFERSEERRVGKEC